MLEFLSFSPEHDPGGKVKLAVGSNITSSAQFSSCGKYRQLLTRCWDPALPSVLFIGMNPSVADLTVDDPTVRKECGFAEREGFGTLLKCNVMDYRATSPRKLLETGVCPTSNTNLQVIQSQLAVAQQVVCVWGKLHPKLTPYAAQVVGILKQANVQAFCLGVNIDGSPKHPLYLANKTRFQPFDLGAYNAS